MPLRIPGVEESGTDADTSLHAAPSQCSMRTPAALPSLSVLDPEAQQSVALTHARP